MKHARFVWEFQTIFSRARIEAGLQAISNSSPSAYDPPIELSVPFAHGPSAVAYGSALETSFCFCQAATLARDTLLRVRSDASSKQAYLHMLFLHIFAALSTTTVMLDSTELYFSSAGKAVADHHRAIVQFVRVRERGRITQRI
ncbi:hypothetical protein SAMN05216338_10692 [Bradyrhizobium sp. Rc2d]|uniref:hypothetical protein n=1 Tax=Bradyrhizobium sp. Rc2d TaxID=1855321 RepID=UPI0008879A15|nr:hypothetical protein [Bradyrhizobium sp. Rc2d]SDJ84434.1 hypothetical protein SAMN05216338_10692 [Bradyrhizobium sp. Rc2d]